MMHGFCFLARSSSETVDSDRMSLSLHYFDKSTISAVEPTSVGYQLKLGGPDEDHEHLLAQDGSEM